VILIAFALVQMDATLKLVTIPCTLFLVHGPVDGILASFKCTKNE